MVKIEFSNEKLLQTAWKRFSEKGVFWVLITVFSLLLTTPTPIPYLSTILFVLSIYFSASITLMTIRYMNGQEVSMEDLLAVDFNTFLHYIFTTLVSALLIILGFLFLILPGFYLMVRLMMAQYLVLDKDMSYDSAIKESWRITKDNELNLMGFLLVMFLIILSGFLAFFIGLLIAIPITQLCTAMLYLMFSKSTASEEDSESLTAIDYE